MLIASLVLFPAYSCGSTSLIGAFVGKEGKSVVILPVVDYQNAFFLSIKKSDIYETVNQISVFFLPMRRDQQVFFI